MVTEIAGLQYGSNTGEDPRAAHFRERLNRDMAEIQKWQDRLKKYRPTHPLLDLVKLHEHTIEREGREQLTRQGMSFHGLPDHDSEYGVENYIGSLKRENRKHGLRRFIPRVFTNYTIRIVKKD